MGLFDELDELDSGSRENILHPPFSYHGGKVKMIDKILPLLPKSGVYVEPCGGSGAIMIAREPTKIEVFNDRYAGVVAFYRCFKDPIKYQRLVDWLDLTIHSRELFLEYRDTWENTEDDVERAAKWYYMLVYSFGSQGRNFGRAISTSCLFGGKIHRYLDSFPAIRNRLVNVQIENQDMFDCIRDYDSPDTVFYIDPPYLDAYPGYAHNIDRQKHIDLLKIIFRIKGFVAISGYPNDIYDRFPWDQRYSWKKLSSARAQSFDANNNKSDSENRTRDTVEEVLWIKE